MSLTKVITVLILSSSTLAFAEPAPEKPPVEQPDNERMWTIHAARMYAEKGNVDKKPVVTDPGVLVTAQRDPQNKK